MKAQILNWSAKLVGKLCLPLIGLAILPVTSKAIDDSWVNPSTSILTIPPQISAVNVTNFGVLQLDTSFSAVAREFPFETSDTLNFANIGFSPFSGYMVSAPGWWFSYYPTTGATQQRMWASSFLNDNDAVIEAGDPFFDGRFPILSRSGPSFLRVWATNIVNKGVLTVGANGGLELWGSEVDLSRSILSTRPIWYFPLGTANDLENGQFIPDVAVHDRGSVQDPISDDDPLFPAFLWDGISTFPLGQVFPYADSYLAFTEDTDLEEVEITTADNTPITLLVPTEVIKGAVFVTAPPDWGIYTTFSVGLGDDGPTMGVLLSNTVPNIVQGTQEPVYVRIFDILAADDAARGLLANVVHRTSRPANYLVDRVGTFFAFPGNWGYPTENFFTSLEYPQLFEALFGLPLPASVELLSDSLDPDDFRIEGGGDFSFYNPFFDNIVSRPPVVPGGTISNVTGRIRISADNLNLDTTRIRGEGHVSIRSVHLVSSTNAVIDCENLSFDLASTNQTLLVQSVAPETVVRFRGEVRLFSAVWNANVVMLFLNYTFDEEGNLEDVEEEEVSVPIRFHTLMVDASGLNIELPVRVFDFTSRAQNVVVGDNLTVVQSFLTTGQSFTMNGSMGLTSTLLETVSGFGQVISMPHWIGTNSPNLLHLTNNGSLTILERANFGADRATPFANIVNNGAIDVGSLSVAALHLENNGFLNSRGQIALVAQDAILANSTTRSDAVIQLLGNTWSLENSTISTLNSLLISVTNMLFDSGEGANNLIQVGNGFRLAVKPALGDLLGTRVESFASAFPTPTVQHQWAGENRGANAAGFLNNAALGALVLSSASPNPLFLFAGTGANNGLYVNTLDISGLTDYTNQIRINSNLTIYFANAVVGFVPPDGLSPEEYLNGQFGGKLVWVSGFPRPTSTGGATVVTLDSPASGQVVHTGSALLQGTAAASAGPAWVYYRINGGNWQPAGIQGLTNWTGNVTLKPGDNVVEAYAIDLLGNRSDASANVNFIPNIPIVVQISGGGSVYPNLNGQLLTPGEFYSMTAYPADGNSFTGWSGGYAAGTPKLDFAMKNDLVLTANFAAIAEYSPTAGSYNGLFYETNEVQFGKSGAFKAKTTKQGKYSGHLQIGKSRYSISGSFDTLGLATNVINRTGQNPLTVFLQMNTGDNSQITGTVSDGDWTAELQADLATFTKSNPAPFAGKYTLLLPGDDDVDPDEPPGDGYAAVNVDAKGQVKVNGSLADGTKLSQTSVASQLARWPVYVSLYGGQGHVIGWMHFEDRVEDDVHGELTWFKPEIANSKTYPDGFDTEIPATGSAYLYQSGTPVLNFTEGSVSLTGGSLTAEILNLITLNSSSKVMNESSNKLVLTVTTPLGLFKGTVTDPNSGETIKFNGAVHQKQNVGKGYFLDAPESGTVRFGP